MSVAAFRHDLYRGKLAVVLGGTSGIGAAIARAFVECGARVLATGATQQELHASSLNDVEDCTLAPLDVRDGDAVQTLIGGIADIDILVNCAGIIRRGQELDPAVFAQVLDINLTGTMRACAAARPSLARRGGCVVNTASMLSFFGGAQAPAYSASKGGVAQLTKSLAIAYASDRIRVNAIAPGWIATALTQPLQDDEARSSAIMARTPFGRWGTPEDVAGAALFLCSPAAAFITGVILAVDGGYLVA